MERRDFLIGTLACLPFSGFAKLQRFSDPRRGYIVKANEGRNGALFLMKGVTQNRLDLKIASADTDGAMSVFVQHGRSPGSGPPLHIHPHQDEWMFILSGSYLIQVGEERYEAGLQDIVFMPKGVPHGFIQKSENATLVVAYSPAGSMEAFFAVTSKLERPLSEEAMAQLFADHDMEIVGPVISTDQ